MVAAGNSGFDLDHDKNFYSAYCPRRTAGYFDETAGFSKAYGACSLFGYLGTSQASPHVAGLAALLIEVYGGNPGAIQRAIERSADQPGGSSVDARYGHGRINVARALGL